MNRATTLLVLMLGLSLTTCNLNTPQDSEKTKALRQMAAETPVYPRFEAIDSTTIAKTTGTTISYYYRCPAPFDEVKSFYVDALAGKGWGVPEEKHWHRLLGGESRQLIFRKGDYSIQIDNETDHSYGWDYSVAFDWEPR
jgi:hypothetical protein